MNKDVERMKYWSIKEWHKYLAYFRKGVTDVRMFNNKVEMTISNYERDGRGVIYRPDIRLILPVPR